MWAIGMFIDAMDLGTYRNVIHKSPFVQELDLTALPQVKECNLPFPLSTASSTSTGLPDTIARKQSL